MRISCATFPGTHPHPSLDYDPGRSPWAYDCPVALKERLVVVARGPSDKAVAARR